MDLKKLEDNLKIMALKVKTGSNGYLQFTNRPIFYIGYVSYYIGQDRVDIYDSLSNSGIVNQKEYNYFLETVKIWERNRKHLNKYK